MQFTCEFVFSLKSKTIGCDSSRLIRAVNEKEVLNEVDLSIMMVFCLCKEFCKGANSIICFYFILL